jgi:osmotically-inducible protein OsmY
LGVIDSGQGKAPEIMMIFLMEDFPMTDSQLRQSVLEELEFDPSIDAGSIGVCVDDGVVTLTGHVSSFAEMLAVENAARRVKGVRALAEELEVRAPLGKKTADDEIAKRALKILEWYGLIPANAVQVTVQHGVVFLSGEVIWQYQRKAAEDAVKQLSGIIDVMNNILIKPAVFSSDIKQKIEDALARHAKIEAHAIRVTVPDENNVLLEGEVDSWDEREAVENAAWSVAGVRSVDNHLTIALDLQAYVV